LRYQVAFKGGARKSTLGRAAIFADDTGQRAISVDSTEAPKAKFNPISDEVVAVI
jgi:hypothetical protein